MTRPRISPNERIPSRPARGKNALASRHSAFSSRGADNIPEYVASVFPEYAAKNTRDVPTLKAIANVVERHYRITGVILSPAALKNPNNGFLAGLVY